MRPSPRDGTPVAYHLRNAQRQPRIATCSVSMRIVLPAVHQSTNTGRTVSADCLVSTSAINNTRLPVAINNISRTVAPGTNEGGDFGSELAGCGKAENAVAPIQMLPKGNAADSGTGLGTRTRVGQQDWPEESWT